MEEKTKSKRSTWFVILACVLVYGNSFFNDFAFDDHRFILEDVTIRDSSNLFAWFTQDAQGLYRPLRQMLYVGAYASFGEHVFGYHMQSLLFHIVNSLLVLGIASALLGRRNSLFAALLFAVHPIHTGRVTNMTGGFDQLGIIFLLAAIFLYVRWSTTGRSSLLYGSLGAFVLGLLSSEEAIVVFPLILAYDYFIRNNIRRKEYVWYGVLSVVYVVLRFFVLEIGARAEGYSGYLRFLAMDIAFVKYLALLFIPVNLTVQHSVSLDSVAFFSPAVIGALAVHGILLGGAWKYRKRFPSASYGIIWFYFALLPMAHIVPIQTIMAERYLYVASAGFCIAFVVLVRWLQQFVTGDVRKHFFAGVLWFVIIVFALLTVSRNLDWRDDITLWSDTVVVSPRSSLAFNNLGFAYDREGLYAEAIPQYQKAILLDTQNYRAYSNLGVAYIRIGEYRAAVRALNQSIQVNPSYPNAHNFLGLAYQELGLPNEARESLLTAVALDPLYYEAFNNLGILYARYGEVEGARQAFSRALTINPSYEDAAFNLGVLEKPQ